MQLPGDEVKEIVARGRLRAKLYRSGGAPALEHGFAVDVMSDGTLAAAWLSDGLARLTGYTQEELSGVNLWTRVVHPDHHTRFAGMVEKTLRGEEVVELLEIVCRSGKTLILRTVLWPAWNAERTRVMRFYGATEDVTAWVQGGGIENSSAIVSETTDGDQEGFSLFRTDGVRLYSSPSVSRILGYAEDELIGADALNLVHPDDRAAVAAGRERVLGAPGRSVRVRFRTRHKNGTWRWLESVFHHLTSEPGVAAVMSSFRDITDRLEQEDTLRKSDEFWQLMVAAAPDFIYVTDLEGRIQYTNHDMNGETALELTGTRIYDFVLEGHRASVEALCEQVVRTQRSTSFETPTVAPGADPVWHEIRVGPLIQGGRLVGLIHCARNVNERKQALDALGQSEALWRSLVDSAPAYIWRLDNDGTVRFANRTLHHGSREGATGTSVLDYVVPKNYEKVESTLERVARTGKPETFDVQGYGNEGAVVWWRTHVGPVVRDGSTDGLIALAWIVTAEKRAEAALRRSKGRLEALSRRLLSVQEEERRHIAREIHDEFGQDLTALKMDLNWIRRNLRRGQEETSARATRAIGLVDLTIDKVRKLARTLRPAALDDLGLVPALEGQVQEFKSYSGVDCVAEFFPDEIELDATVALTVFRVFQESLTNVARHARATQVHATLRVTGDILKLSIRDNGRGITKREKSSPKSHGLIGVRERVRSCHGRVRISGTPRGGTVVEITVPIDARRGTGRRQ